MKVLSHEQVAFAARAIREASALGASVRICFPGGFQVQQTHTGHVLIMQPSNEAPQTQYKDVDSMVYAHHQTLEHEDVDALLLAHGQERAVRGPRLRVRLQVYTDSKPNRAVAVDIETDRALISANVEWVRYELRRRGWELAEEVFMSTLVPKVRTDGVTVMQDPKTGMCFDPSTGKATHGR